MKLSIVTTLYQSGPTICEFYRRAIEASAAITDDVELVFVNDGSSDNSLELAIALCDSDPRIKIIDLSRNFGHHKALMTGLCYARGDLVFLIDSDLQEDPEALGRLYERLSKGDCDVVYGYQPKRQGSLFERITGGLYFSLVDMLSDGKIPRNLLTLRLMTNEYVRALIRYRDREFVISQLWAISGYRQIGLPVQKRPARTRSYSLSRRIEYVVKHVTTTSTKLLYAVFYGGLGLFSIAGGIIVFFLCRYLFFGVRVSGFTSIIISIWLFGGLTILILGIIAIYIANILSETKRRPYTVVRRVYRAHDKAKLPAGDTAQAPSTGRATG